MPLCPSCGVLFTEKTNDDRVKQLEKLVAGKDKLLRAYRTGSHTLAGQALNQIADAEISLRGDVE